ncbi:MAG TPA: hypothetical protein VKU41_07780 [Polyangiaceae bacterium]|nr:hypothetical protein [Polyangiaceae bacterium]
MSDVVRAVHVRVWGFWGPDTAGVFSKRVLDSYRQGYAMTVDATALKPLREVGESAFETLMTALPRVGVQRVSVRVSSPLTRLQLIRIAKGCSIGSMIQFTSD